MAETKPVRPGEEIDTDRLRAFLEGRLGTHDEIEIEQFPGGSSNLTYLVRLRENHLRERVVKSLAENDADFSSTFRPPADAGGSALEFVLRRPPFGNTVKTAHDMRREFDVLSKLSAAYQPAPKPLLFCEDESVIGSEFYLMERRHGLIIRGKIPVGPQAASLREDSENFGTQGPLKEASGKHSQAGSLRSDDLGTNGVGSPHESKGSVSAESTTDFGTQECCTSPCVSKGDTSIVQSKVTPADLEMSHEARHSVCRSFIANLADLHTLDYKAAGLETLGRIDGYNRRQVEGWTKRYFAAKTHDWDALEKAIKWLNENIPAESSASLIHNDYKFDNVMLDPEDLGRITAVLDWEMVTVGDPLMDLGTTLGYWMSSDAGEEMLNMPFNPRVLMTNISRRELVEMYAESLGRNVPDMLFYYVFGTFKIAVIAQQIYARYVRGFTKDSRFSMFDRFVASLGTVSFHAVDRNSI